jgi:hypothetical protein
VSPAAGRKKPAAKKPAAKKSTGGKTPVKASVAKKNSGKKAVTKTASTKKPVVTKPAAKKSPAKKSPAKKSPAKKSPAKKSPAKKSPAPVRVTARRAGGQNTAALTPTLHLLDVPFDERMDAKWAGARWDPTLRRWVHRGAHLPTKLSTWAARPHSLEQWLQDDLNGSWSDTSASADIVLRPHQDEAAELIAASHDAGRPGFLLADSVGLGKTYEVIAGVERLGEGLNVLVVCPLSVVAHWRRSIDAHGSSQRWCVINYDKLKSLLEEPESAKSAVRTRTKNKRRAAQGRALIDFDVVVADESHLLRNVSSQRSAAFRQVIKGHGEAAFVVWVSATAGQNPLELAYLAPLLAAVTGDKVRDLDQIEQWCRDRGIRLKRGAYGSWAWEPNEEDLHTMRDLLFTPHDGVPAGIRRRPEDIAGWPSQQRILMPMDLGRRERNLYDEAWTEFRRMLELSPGDTNPQGALAALTRFRQKASLLRVADTAEFVADLVADGLQVPISVAFLETAEKLAEALGRKGIAVSRVTGNENAQLREQERIRFQTEQTQVVLFTVTEGVSFHAGEQAVGAGTRRRATVVHDMRWSAIATAQIEGRAHRDGQNALCYYTYATDTVEERVTKVVLDRLTSMATMIGDDTNGMDVLRAVLG